MSKNPRGYTGLQQPPNFQIPLGGQVHNLRRPTHQEMQAMLSQQLEVLAREIYVRTVSKRMAGEAEWDSSDLQDVAVSSRLAAKAYFQAAGVKFEDESPADADDVGPEPQPPDGQ